MSVAATPTHPIPPLTSFERKQLEAVLAHTRQDYNPDSRMLRTPFASPGYHTTFEGPFVHETRQSLKFAVALLDTGAPQDLSIASNIIEKVISLQDTHPESHTYGIWPWFLEESLEEMDPPDWNWADFCGAQLLEARLTHADRMSPRLVNQIDAALYHASNAIIKRNVGLDYTNILVMGSFVVLLTGEMLTNTYFIQFATDRLKRFHDYTFQQGSFAEFNSPPYTIVTLNELRRLQRYTVGHELRPLIDELYELAWEEIAHHFHPQTAQWSGPHSRCYKTLLTPQIESVLYRALGRENPDECTLLDQHRLSHQCPAKFRHYFESQSSPATESHTVTKAFPAESPKLVYTTYHHPQFSLGTTSHSDMFNQRRSLLAYWGEPEQARTLRLRFLHDDYDFTTMQFYSAQQEGHILAAIGMATDGGDRHPYFDRISNGQFEATDLRLRFELEGVTPDKIQELEMNQETGSAHFLLDGIHLKLNIYEATFGGHKGILETSFEENHYYIDLVFYSGSLRTFKLGPDSSNTENDKRVAIAFTTELSTTPPQNASPQAISQEREGGKTCYTWRNLEVTAQSTPAPRLSM